MGLTDYVVMFIVSAAWFSGTVFLFIHPSEVNFATWAGLAVTIGGIYHWITVYDDKKPDDNQ